jgi:hypothetical protein
VPLVIEPYSAAHVPAIRGFNRRLRDGGETLFQFPESEIPEWLPKYDGRRIFQEMFVAASGAEVHGGYILKHQDFSFRGAVRPVGYYHLPLSEGLIDKAYSLLGAQLLFDALRRQPVLYALGMGGFDRPLPRMLEKAGWKLSAVPFYFKVLHPFRFLRNIRTLRTTPLRRLALDFAAYSGLGPLAFRSLRIFPAAAVNQAPSFEIVPEFSAWADDLWQRCHPLYAMAGSRNSATLRILYPAGNPRFIKVMVRAAERVAGWAVLLSTPMQDDSYFGRMRVGAIADCFGAPEDAGAVIAASAATLEAAGVDLIISNQSHRAWCTALRRAGFRPGPSNFLFAASKKLAALLDPWDAALPQIHLTRGDGDGPIHL